MATPAHPNLTVLPSPDPAQAGPPARQADQHPGFQAAGGRDRHAHGLRGHPGPAHRSHRDRDPARADGRPPGGRKKLTLVPILRAGLGMVDGMAQLIPSARVGHIGLSGTRTRSSPSTTTSRSPAPRTPATSSSSIRCSRPAARPSPPWTRSRTPGRARIRFLCLVAAPEGVRAHGAAHPDVPVFAAALDRQLNARLHSPRPGRRRRPAVRHPMMAEQSVHLLGRRRRRSPARCTCSRPPAPASCSTPACSRAAGRPTRELNADAPLRCPADRRDRAEPRAHRPLRPAAAAGPPRVPRADLRHARHARPLRRDAARRRAHPGEGLRVPGAPRPGRPRERAALHHGRRRRGAGPDRRRCRTGGSHHLRKHLALEFTDAGHILGSASVDLRITEGGGPPARLLRRHRPRRTADHPRPDPADRPDRHADRRVHLRQPRRTSPWPTPRSGWASSSAGRPARGGKVLVPAFAAGPRTGAGVRPAPALAREGRPGDPDLRRQPAGRRRDGGVPPAPRDLRLGASSCWRAAGRLFDFPLLRYVRDVADSKR